MYIYIHSNVGSHDMNNSGLCSNMGTQWDPGGKFDTSIWGASARTSPSYIGVKGNFSSVLRTLSSKRPKGSGPELYF